MFIENLQSDAELAVIQLRKDNLRFDYTTVSTRADLINALNEFKPDLIIVGEPRHMISEGWPDCLLLSGKLSNRY